MTCRICRKTLYVRACDCDLCHAYMFHDTAHLPGCTLLARLRREPEGEAA